MIKLKERIQGLSDFSKNVITLMTGTMLAQAIPVAISPVLTRLYSPDDFGVFALYISITAILSALITARYELAIMLPKTNSEAINLVALSLVIAVSLSLFFFIIVCFFKNSIASILGNEDIENWLFFIPLSTLIAGTYQSLNYWSNRNKKYKRLASAKITQSSIKSGSNIVFGYLNYGTIGLVFGHLIGQISSTLLLLFISLKNDTISFSKDVSIQRIKELAKKYVKFPKFDLPSSLSFTLYSNMSIIFFNKFFVSSISGFYFFANRLLKVPFSFFITAFSDVFYQKLSSSGDNYQLISKEVNHYSNKLLIFTIIPFYSVVYLSFFYAEFIFGAEWKELWKYMYIFSLPIYLALLISPYGHVLKIVNRQEVSFYLHFTRLVVVASFFISYFVLDYKLMNFLVIFSLIEAIMHIFLSFFVDKIIKNKKLVKNLFIRVVILIILSTINYLSIF